MSAGKGLILAIFFLVLLSELFYITVGEGGCKWRI
jgi:hypothetical protein